MQGGGLALRAFVRRDRRSDVALAERLTRDDSGGFSQSGLTRKAKRFDGLPEEHRVATLSQQLSRSTLAGLIGPS